MGAKFEIVILEEVYVIEAGFVSEISSIPD